MERFYNKSFFSGDAVSVVTPLSLPACPRGIAEIQTCIPGTLTDVANMVEIKIIAGIGTKAKIWLAALRCDFDQSAGTILPCNVSDARVTGGILTP